jgi:hypothetical protein
MSQAQLLLFGDFTIEVPRLVHQNPSAEPTSMMLSSDNIVVQQLMDDGTPGWIAIASPWRKQISSEKCLSMAPTPTRASRTILGTR